DDAALYCCHPVGAGHDRAPGGEGPALEPIAEEQASEEEVAKIGHRAVVGVVEQGQAENLLRRLEDGEQIVSHGPLVAARFHLRARPNDHREDVPTPACTCIRTARLLISSVALVDG